jgi:hypothetical protein
MDKPYRLRPITRPRGTHSPSGRGEKRCVAPVALAARTAHRPRPFWGEGGVRGNAVTDFFRLIGMRIGFKNFF